MTEKKPVDSIVAAREARVRKTEEQFRKAMELASSREVAWSEIAKECGYHSGKSAYTAVHRRCKAAGIPFPAGLNMRPDFDAEATFSEIAELRERAMTLVVQLDELAEKFEERIEATKD